MDNIIWLDKKRYFGKPISLTEYALTAEKLYCTSGLVFRQTTEVLLYRVIDITLIEDPIDRIFCTGTLKLKTRIDSDEYVYISHIASPVDVRNLLSEKIKEAYKENKVIKMES